jgi:hypothetical protein
MAQRDDEEVRKANEVWKFVRQHYNPQKHGPVFTVKDPLSEREQSFTFKISKLPGDRYIVLWQGVTLEKGFIKNGGFG